MWRKDSDKMPIPDDRTEWTFDEIVKAYLDLGWKKELEFPWIEYDQRNRRILIVNYKYMAQKNPCTTKSCMGSDLVFLDFRPTGVFWTCGTCRRTMGPLAFEDAYEASPPKEVTYDEAMNILKTTHQITPIGLAPTMRRRVIRR